MDNDALWPRRKKWPTCSEPPATVTQAALFPVAYTIGTDFRPAARPPAESITYWDTWGQIADAVLHRAIPRRRATEEGVAGAASAGAAGRAAAAGSSTWPAGSMEILNEGNEAGEGLVRTCIYRSARSTCCPAAGRGRGRR